MLNYTTVIIGSEKNYNILNQTKRSTKERQAAIQTDGTVPVASCTL